MSRIYSRSKIQTIEKGCLYKVKENPFWDNIYTIFCASYTKNVIEYNDFRYMPFVFCIDGSGKSAHIVIGTNKERHRVRIIHGQYVKKLTIKDYMKVSRVLKNNGYKFDKKNGKLVKL
jgi:hypothetical protein